MHIKSRARSTVVVASALSSLVLLLGLGTGSASAGASSSPITIAYVTSVTGPGASEDGSSPAAFNARIDLQNAEGGVDGHKLVALVIDDETSPTEVATAVQEADGKALGIVSQSPLFFLAAKYPNQAGIPVTGSYSDGPEWGTPPYTNMFAVDNGGSLNPKYPVNTLQGDFLKSKGATVLGTYGYGISPSSSRDAIQSADSFKHAGGKVGVLNTSVPFGSVAYTPDALVAKEDHVDAVVPAMDDNSNFALAEALYQAGVKLKTGFFGTGYEPSVINSTAWPALQGVYFASFYRPWSLPNAGTEQMQAAMKKYAHFSKSQFPTFSQYEAWVGTDLMIKGLELAGPNPTRAQVIKDLRNLKNYTANGLEGAPVNYSTNFGHDPAKSCLWVVKAEKSGFVAQQQEVCGSDIPGTATANSS